jgi:hypothetical protein
VLKWVVSAKLKDVELGLQEMLDALPDDGGTVHISEGVYEISEPLRMPTKGNVNISGCHFIGDKKKPKTVTPGKVTFEGTSPTVYWGKGDMWMRSRTKAIWYRSKDEAERATFGIVSKKPTLVGSITVEKLP